MLDDTIVDYTERTTPGSFRKVGTEAANLRENIALKLGIPVSSVALDSLEWLGFFSNENSNTLRPHLSR